MAGAERPAIVIRDVEFLGPMTAPGGWRPAVSLPEIAFAGRSNVGKSSLINRLLNRKGMARVSTTPGRTREIHFYRVNDDFILVDLPGYGYARVSKQERAGWRPLIEGYLTGSEALRGVVQLLDVRHDPTRDDLQMLDFLSELGVPVIIVATKIDKVAARARGERLAALARTLEMDEEQIVPFSAVTGRGRDELLEAAASLLSQASWRHT